MSQKIKTSIKMLRKIQQKNFLKIDLHHGSFHLSPPPQYTLLECWIFFSAFLLSRHRVDRYCWCKKYTNRHRSCWFLWAAESWMFSISLSSKQKLLLITLSLSEGFKLRFLDKFPPPQWHHDLHYEAQVLCCYCAILKEKSTLVINCKK